MAYLDNMQGLSEAPRRISDKSTLLKKYDIPLQYLDYDYVEKCTNAREIEKILHILRSGEEGFYPDLIKKTEDRLKKLKPNSKFLRQVTPVINKTALDNNEQKNINNEMNYFIKEMEKNSEELNAFKGVHNSINVPIRASKTNWDDTYRDRNQNSKRISSTDYASWDKYDVDTELLKLNLEEERMKQEAEKKLNSKPKVEKTVKFNQFHTTAEALYESNREREKGNEFYRVGDYKDALHHYTNSINCHSNVNAYNNRALVYIKLKKYESAINDCNLAIKLEPLNAKAHFRKAQCYEALKQYKEALNSVEVAIEVDPNNSIGQQLAERLRNQLGIKTTGETKRLTIVEVDNDENKRLKLSVIFLLLIRFYGK